MSETAAAGEKAIGERGARRRRTPRWRRAARLGPAACAVHCLATPFVVGVVPWLGHGRGAELGLALSSLAVAGWLLAGDVRAHGRRRYAALLALTGAAWLLTIALAPEALESVLAPLLGLGAAATLVSSARLREAVGDGCACPAPDRPGPASRAAA